MAHNVKVMSDDLEDNTTLPEIILGGQRVSYSSVVGSFMYAMLGTRPDIAYLVGVLG